MYVSAPREGERQESWRKGSVRSVGVWVEDINLRITR
jgi:hypothetical protein